MAQMTRAQIDQGMKQARIERAIAFQTGIKAVRAAISSIGGRVSAKITTAKRFKNYHT